MAALQYLESQKNAHPELTEWYNSLADLYQKKLWHQLTLKLEHFIALSVFQVSLSLPLIHSKFHPLLVSGIRVHRSRLGFTLDLKGFVPTVTLMSWVFLRFT